MLCPDAVPVPAGDHIPVSVQQPKGWVFMAETDKKKEPQRGGPMPDGASVQDDTEGLRSKIKGARDELRESLTHAYALKVQEEARGWIQEEFVRISSELGVRIAAVRCKALTGLCDSCAEKIKEVEGKDWPESLKVETIGQIFALQKSFADEIMGELNARNGPTTVPHRQK
jgi:hypothetical protein